MSLLRLLAAALAGGLGAFGVPAGAHASAQSPTPGAAAAPVASAPDAAPN